MWVSLKFCMNGLVKWYLTASPKYVGKFEVLHEWFSEMVPYCKLIMIAQSDLHQSTFLCWENSRDLVPVLTVGRTP